MISNSTIEKCLTKFWTYNYFLWYMIAFWIKLHPDKPEMSQNLMGVNVITEPVNVRREPINGSSKENDLTKTSWRQPSNHHKNSNWDILLVLWLQRTNCLKFNDCLNMSNLHLDQIWRWGLFRHFWNLREMDAWPGSFASFIRFQGQKKVKSKNKEYFLSKNRTWFTIKKKNNRIKYFI